MRACATGLQRGGEPSQAGKGWAELAARARLDRHGQKCPVRIP